MRCRISQSDVQGELFQPLLACCWSICTVGPYDVTPRSRRCALIWKSWIHVANMASALRGIHRLVSVARPAGIRPTLPFVAKGRCIASISQRHRSIPPCQAESSRLRPQWTLVLKRAEVPPSRNYADDSAMTLDTLQDRVIDVLKMFDKIDPDKVLSWWMPWDCTVSMITACVGDTWSPLCERPRSW